MTIKVACLGAGYFSQFHYGSWARCEEVTVVGACDHDAARAGETGAPPFTSLDAMLAETQPDLLDIILPPPAHASAIRTALAAGIRWIICQKPFCTSITEAEAMTAEIEAAGATLVVHENFRFQPWYRAIKAQIEAGAIGDVLNATFRLRPGDGQGPRAYLDRQPYFQQMERFLIHETAVHWVDTFQYLFGPTRSVYADLRQINPVIAGEDAGHVIFDHASGVRALFDGNRLLDHAADNHRRTMGEALIEGTQGTLTLRGDGSVGLRRFGTLAEDEVLAPDTWDGFGGDCVHTLNCHVLEAMRSGAPVENAAADYLSVVRVENAIYRAAQEARKISL